MREVTGVHQLFLFEVIKPKVPVESERSKIRRR